MKTNGDVGKSQKLTILKRRFYPAKRRFYPAKRRFYPTSDFWIKLLLCRIRGLEIEHPV